MADTAGIGTSAEVIAPGWEFRFLKDIAERLPPCKTCGGKMSIASKNPRKKPHISCRNAGCKAKSVTIAPEEWEVANV